MVPVADIDNFNDGLAKNRMTRHRSKCSRRARQWGANYARRGEEERSCKFFEDLTRETHAFKETIALVVADNPFPVLMIKQRTKGYYIAAFNRGAQVGAYLDFGIRQFDFGALKASVLADLDVLCNALAGHLLCCYLKFIVTQVC